ncbi:MAG: hypothetical protein F8N15_05010 [Methanobacterium sp.]|nr:hypothetical protein [Methanobacterium sp.]
MRDRPKPTPLSNLYLNIFWQLSADRSVGMGEGPIPWSSIDRFAVRKGISGEEFDSLVRMIRAADDEYFKTKAEKTESEERARKEE